MMTSLVKDISKTRLIENLYWIADYDSQKKALSNPSGPVIWSFIENDIGIFEDSGLRDLFAANKVVFGGKADLALRELDNIMGKIDHQLPDDVIVDLPAMRLVRKKAIKTLKLVLASNALNSVVPIIVIVYIAVNNGDYKGVRPAKAQELPSGFYKLLATTNYEINKQSGEKNLKWQFSKGDTVRCQKKYAKGNYYLLAVAKA